jgi:hypothetical protein
LSSLVYDPDDPESAAQLEEILALRAQAEAAKAEMKRREWLADPVLFVNERLEEFCWSKQREVLRSVVANKYTAVPSAHSTGKSWLAARAVAHWIETHPPGTAKVVTSATTWSQIEKVLWGEFRRVHAKAKLSGRTNRTEWVRPLVGGDGKAEEIVAYGHRPADSDPTAFQGIHAENVLLVLDEAVGIPRQLADSADSLISNEGGHALAIFNPTDPTSWVYKACQPGSGWNVIRISAFDTPNVYKCRASLVVQLPSGERRVECGWEGSYKDVQPGNLCPSCNTPLPPKEVVPDNVRRSLVDYQWVKLKTRQYGRTNPLYYARILGEFPEFNADALIPMHWLRKAHERWEEDTTLDKVTTPVELGVDVGGGSAKNVIACRRGRRVSIIHEDYEPDTMKTRDKIIQHLVNEGASVAKVDYIGIGHGAVDSARSDKNRTDVVGIEVGKPAVNTEAYLNLRAEGYWLLRELLRPDNPNAIALDPNDDETAAQLLDIRYQATNNSRIQIESKDSMKRRGINSPDRADAVMLACLPTDHGVDPNLHVTWGRDMTKYNAHGGVQ